MQRLLSVTYGTSKYADALNTVIDEAVIVGGESSPRLLTCWPDWGPSSATLHGLSANLDHGPARVLGVLLFTAGKDVALSTTV